LTPLSRKRIEGIGFATEQKGNRKVTVSQQTEAR
jgi:hypothetical protein